MRAFLLTPAFCKSALLEDCLSYLHGQDDLSWLTHVVWDNHYPVNMDKNRQEIFFSAHKHNCIYLSSNKDIGLHQALNAVVDHLKIGPNDFLAGCDPDDRPSKGAIRALYDVMKSKPNYAVLGLNFSVIQERYEQGIQFQHAIRAGHHVWEHPGVEMFNVAAFNMGLIHSMGGFKQPFAYYGGIEMEIYVRAAPLGMSMAYLAAHRSDAVPMNREDRNLFDPEYRAWKTAHVSGYPHGFEQFLIDRGESHLIG